MTPLGVKQGLQETTQQGMQQQALAKWKQPDLQQEGTQNRRHMLQVWYMVVGGVVFARNGLSTPPWPIHAAQVRSKALQHTMHLRKQHQQHHHQCPGRTRHCQHENATLHANEPNLESNLSPFFCISIHSSSSSTPNCNTQQPISNAVYNALVWISKSRPSPCQNKPSNPRNPRRKYAVHVPKQRCAVGVSFAYHRGTIIITSPHMPTAESQR